VCAKLLNEGARNVLGNAFTNISTPLELFRLELQTLLYRFQVAGFCYSAGHITPQSSSYSEWKLVCRLIISNSNQPSTK
jgi:hypothetical protein